MRCMVQNLHLPFLKWHRLLKSKHNIAKNPLGIMTCESPGGDFEFINPS